MKSQVSFKFDGSHNKPFIINILKSRLKGFRYKIENESQFVYRIYVASEEGEQRTFDECYKIQCFVVYDYSKEVQLPKEVII